MACAVLLAALGFAVWNRYFSQASPVNPGTSCPVVVQPTGHVPLASIGTKRVALIGDSIMYQASCSVADSLARVGIQTGRYAVIGSGLLDGPVDWLKMTATILATLHPDVVLAEFAGNYWGSLGSPGSNPAVREDSPQFFTLWQHRAVQLSNEVQSSGAAMYWVSAPPIDVPPLSHAQGLYAGYTTIPGDGAIDAGAVLAGPGGQEVMTTRSCGHQVVVRTPDRIHLTADGGRIYGQEIAHLFTAQTGLLTSPRPC